MNATQTHEHKISAHAAEAIYARALDLTSRQVVGAMEKGMRVARAQHPLLLRTLDACAERMEAVEEGQRGQTRRMARDNMRARAHEASIFREAYRLADKGEPMEHYCYVYAAAAEHAGIIERAR
jgi:hypothetical protein